MKATLDAAKAWIAAGNIPASILMTNKKTGFSVMDNVPQLVCFGSCPVRRKCYDVKILKLRPNVLVSRARRHYFMISNPSEYAAQAVREIRKLRDKKGVTKIRIYTGGDYSPFQLPILRSIIRAVPDVTFYMISKMIRGFKAHAIELLRLPNFFLNLSEMADFQFGAEWAELRDHPRVNSVYTLLPDETDFAGAKASDIVFNVTKAKKAIAKYKLNKLPLCPCDSKDIPSKGACDNCGLCATKGGVSWAMSE